MNRNYERGRRLEWERCKFWGNRGYDVVRAAGSHGVMDVVAVRVDVANKHGDVFFEQVKGYKPSGKELYEFEAFERQVAMVDEWDVKALLSIREKGRPWRFG